MQECLESICREFETCSNFINDRTEQKVETINKIFLEFMECFASLKEEKLDYPKEFISDVKYYNEGNKPLVKKFEDIEMRYLMLSDFYDYCRITKKYTV